MIKLGMLVKTLNKRTCRIIRLETLNFKELNHLEDFNKLRIIFNCFEFILYYSFVYP